MKICGGAIAGLTPELQKNDKGGVRLLPRDAGGDDECEGGRVEDGEAAVCRGFLAGVVVGGGELRRCYPCCPAAWKK